MKRLFVIAACLLSLGLAACGSSSDSQQSTNPNVDTAQKKSVFEGYVKDVNKAKQVQKKIDAAQKKLKAKIKQAEAGGGH